MNEILEILSENAKATPAEIAALLGRDEQEIAKEIKELEDLAKIQMPVAISFEAQASLIYRGNLVSERIHLLQKSIFQIL